MPGKKLEPVVESECIEEHDGVWVLKLAEDLDLSVSLQCVTFPAEIVIPKGLVGLVQVSPSEAMMYSMAGSQFMPPGRYTQVRLWVVCLRGMATLFAGQPIAEMVFVKG